MPNFDYNRDVPDGPNNPSDDQPDMKINTNSIDNIIAVDHYSFKNNNGGIHKQVRLINQAAPGFAGANGVLYANQVSAGVFGNSSFPIWQNSLGTFLLINHPTADQQNGFTSLPGGILMQWGKQAGSSANTIPVVFGTTFKKAGVNTPAYTVQVIPERAASNPGNELDTVIVTGSVTATGFTIGNIGSHSIASWYWLAIGPLS